MSCNKTLTTRNFQSKSQIQAVLSHPIHDDLVHQINRCKNILYEPSVCFVQLFHQSNPNIYVKMFCLLWRWFTKYITAFFMKLSTLFKLLIDCVQKNYFTIRHIHLEKEKISPSLTSIYAQSIEICYSLSGSFKSATASSDSIITVRVQVSESVQYFIWLIDSCPQTYVCQRHWIRFGLFSKVTMTLNY